MTTPIASLGSTGTDSDGDLGSALDAARADGSLDFSDLASALAELGDAVPPGTTITGQDPETPAPAPAAAPTDANGSPLPKAGDPSSATAPATPAATDEPAPPPSTDTTGTPAITPDPLDAATALTYTVDGETRTFDGILEVKGEGAIIPADHLNAVRDRLQLADKREADNRALYQQVQTFEQAGGLPKLHDLTAKNAALNALVGKMGEAFDNLDQFLVYGTDGRVTVDPRARDLFYRELALTAREAQGQAARTVTEAQRTAEQVRSTEAQSAAEATQGVAAAVDSFVAELGLPAEDRAAALAHFGPFAGALIKTMTPDLAAQHPGFRAGDKYVDRAAMVAWFSDRQTLRAEMTKQAEAARAATAENAKRLAAVVSPPKPPVTPNRPNAKGGEETPATWDQIKKAWRRGQTVTADD